MHPRLLTLLPFCPSHPPPRSTGLNYRAILDTALDIAKAMCHLHAMNVLHSDLKARNVMLKSSGDSRGITAKVADFGLSVKMDQSETHMSNLFQVRLSFDANPLILLLLGVGRVFGGVAGRVGLVWKGVKGMGYVVC